MAFFSISERKKLNRKIKKMCRARGKNRAREDQNHDFFLPRLTFEPMSIKF